MLAVYLFSFVLVTCTGSAILLFLLKILQLDSKTEKDIIDKIVYFLIEEIFINDQFDPSDVCMDILQDE